MALTERRAYDALLIVSFGGPEGMADVMPFLENVLRGRNVPRERMLEVAHHYALFDGISPLNGQNRALITALQDEFKARGLDLPIYWGNRNWHPLLADTFRQMARDGIRHPLAFITSAYSSYSGCRQYQEDIAPARAEVGPDAPQVSILRKFYNHPGFIQANIDHLRAALDLIPTERRSAAHIAFTAHSIPEAMARGSMYEAQLLDACQLVAAGLDNLEYSLQWRLVYQSRSGSPQQPWLGPDICDHLRELKAQGVQSVVVAPIGFISDHMEVVYDLDTEARAVAEEIGLIMVRASTPGIHPAFVGMIYELVMERITDSPIKRSLGMRGPSHDVCADDCCLSGRPVSASAAKNV